MTFASNISCKYFSHCPFYLLIDLLLGPATAITIIIVIVTVIFT